MPLDPRYFLAATGGAVVGLIGGSSGGRPAQARAPASRTQAPRFYRSSLGRFQVTVVSDGAIAFPAQALWPEAGKAERDAVLVSNFQPTDKSHRHCVRLASKRLDLGGRAHVGCSYPNVRWGCRCARLTVAHQPGSGAQ
jgi:hypothetical protein